MQSTGEQCGSQVAGVVLDAAPLKTSLMEAARSRRACSASSISAALGHSCIPVAAGETVALAVERYRCAAGQQQSRLVKLMHGSMASVRPLQAA